MPRGYHVLPLFVTWYQEPISYVLLVMASSTSSITSGLPSIAHPVTEKLTRSNYPMWRAHVLAVLRGAQVAGYLDGSIPEPAKKIVVKKGEVEQEVPNPDHAVWAAQEQQVLSYLLLSSSRDVLTQVVSIPTAAGVWTEIEGMFASQSRARHQHAHGAGDDAEGHLLHLRVHRQDAGTS